MSDATVPPFTVRDWGDRYRWAWHCNARGCDRFRHSYSTREAAERGGEHHQKESHR